MLTMFVLRYSRRPWIQAALIGMIAWSSLPGADSSNGSRPEPDSADIEFFERRIRPVLAEHCLKCHGSGKQESGLRLDSRAFVLQGGDSGPAAMPGRPEDSLLMSVIEYDGDVQMPPDAELSRQQVEAVRLWIRKGLPWPESGTPASPASLRNQADSHWAFQPIASPDPPATRNQSWPRTPIDRFVLHRLEAAALSPARRAAPEVLIRRATLDLLGLPPAPDESAAFLQAWQTDASVAWRELIDRLLSSPHYGERQARHWLDIARYADNKGYVFFEQKEFPWAWTYRDWVVNAFNEDLPFDTFVRRQLAADLTDPDNAAEQAALGFLTVGPRFINNPHDIIDDRIDVVTRGLLGLTVSCARCHDHKFDPVPQEDYYSLYGIFRSSVEPIRRPLIAVPPDTEEHRQFTAGLDERIQALEKFIDDQRRAMMRGARERLAEYLLAVHAKRDQPSTENFMLIAAKGDLIPAMIHRWEVYLKRARRRGDPVWTIWNAFSDLADAEFESRSPEVWTRLCGNRSEGREDAADEATPVNPLVRAAFAAAVPASMDDVARTYGELFTRMDARWRQQSTDDGDSARPTDRHEEALWQVLYGAGSPPMVPDELGWGFLDLLPDRPTQAEFKKLLGEVEKFSTSSPGAPPRAMVLVDRDPPYDPVVFLRGNPNREGDPVPRRFLTLLGGDDSSPYENGSGRRELAEAIVHPDNPLTARVFVNRIWQQHFGTGLVSTSSDFGLRSDAPSHPELLDWLATRFRTEGWSVKDLHRLIMTSAVYQQSGIGRIDGAGVDPANRLLWRYPRRRLDFETLRDAHLRVAGALEDKLGGPPVDILKGYQQRRTLYGFIDRMDLPGLLRTFDYPEPVATSAARSVTTVPQQALFFLNHEFVIETARRLIARQDVSELDGRARLTRLHEVVLGRQPTERELSVAEDYISTESSHRESAAAWSYGYGAVDSAAQRVTEFTPLTHWTGTRWQAGPELPDARVGWAFHDRTGGHPGEADDRCFILRWTAPGAGRYAVTGVLTHRPEPGNGVRARLVSSAAGILGEWTVDMSSLPTNVSAIELSTGDHLDFVVDWRGHITHDEFEWPVVVVRENSSSTAGEELARWDSQAEFSGPRLSGWVRYAQALLMTNEFAFIE